MHMLLLRWIGLILPVVLLVGCAGRDASTGTVEPSAGAPLAGLTSPFALPAPASLLAPARSTSSSFSEADVTQSGDQFDPALPHNGVAANGTQGWFTPTWDLGAASHMLSEMAYCTYHFEIPGYDRDASIRTQWSLSDDTTTYVALANWDTDRWDWFKLGDVDLFLPGTMDPYLNIGDDLLLVVAIVGTQPCKLDSIRIGGYPPVAALSVSDTHGPLQYPLTMDASATSDPDGLPLTYEFDVDGDGTFESGPQSSPTYDTTAPSLLNGAYQATVQVTNSINATSTASVTIYAVWNWASSWGQGSDEQFRDVAVDNAGWIYAVGDQKSPGDLLFTKWTPAGGLVWAQYFDNGGQDTGYQVEVDGDGNLIVAGTTQVAGQNRFLIQKWSPAGTILWSKQCAPGAINVVGLYQSSGSIYMAGNAGGLTAQDDIVVFKLDTNGNVIWQKYRNSGGRDILGSITPIFSLTGFGGLSLMLASDESGDYNLYRTEVSTAGGFSSEQQLGTSALPKRNGRMIRTYNIITGDVFYYVTGQIDSGLGFDVFTAKFDDSGTSLWANEAINNQSFPRGAVLTTGNQFFVPYGSTGNPSDSWWMAFDVSDGTTPWDDHFHYDAGSSSFGGQARADGLVFGGWSPDSSYNFFTLPADLSPISLTWSNKAFSGGDPGYSLSDTGGSTTDVTAQGVLNAGAGGDDALLFLFAQL